MKLKINSNKKDWKTSFDFAKDNNRTKQIFFI